MSLPLPRTHRHEVRYLLNSLVMKYIVKISPELIIILLLLLLLLRGAVSPAEEEMIRAPRRPQESGAALGHGRRQVFGHGIVVVVGHGERPPTSGQRP
jgi:hypothetical protein